MATEITTTTGFNALSEPQQQEHRQKIGVRARSILRQFWFDAETPPAEQALELEGWMDVLQVCSHSEIRAAWAQYQREGPRAKSGRLARPDAGALYRIAMKNRPRPAPASKPKPKSAPRCSPEVAAEIVKAAGFTPKRFGRA